MHNNNAAQTNVTNFSKALDKADGWLKLRIYPVVTSENPNPKLMQITRDAPLYIKSLVSRSLVNMEIAHQKANPGAEPLEFNIIGTINIPGANDDKADLQF